MSDKGTFRKKNGFTIAGNTLVRDDTVSLKAKGLYLLIMSYVTMEDFALTKGFLQGKCNEGEKAFCSAWDELKEKGYLKIYMSPSNPGWKAEYELLEEPKPGPHTYYLSADGSVVSDNERKYRKSGEPEKADAERTPQNGRYANGTYAKGTYAKGTYAEGTYANGGYNINTPRKTLSNTPHKTSSPSVPPVEPRKEDKLEKMLDKMGIAQSPYGETLRPVIADLWRTRRIGSTTYPRKELESALSGLTPELLAAVVEKYERQQKKGGISLPGEYLKALLLRAPQEAALSLGLQGGNGASEKDAPSYDIDEYVRISLAKMNGPK